MVRAHVCVMNNIEEWVSPLQFRFYIIRETALVRQSSFSKAQGFIILATVSRDLRFLVSYSRDDTRNQWSSVSPRNTNVRRGTQTHNHFTSPTADARCHNYDDATHKRLLVPDCISDLRREPTAWRPSCTSRAVQREVCASSRCPRATACPADCRPTPGRCTRSQCRHRPAGGAASGRRRRRRR